jgi:putative membrane protein
MPAGESELKMSEESLNESAVVGAVDSGERRSEALTWRDDVRYCASGFLMGAADIVPGVSGGTMALIVGIYERLIAAISRIDRDCVGHLLARRFWAAFHHADLRFLIVLGCGILLGAGGLASMMKLLLNDHRSHTYAAFTGMILASSLIVSRRVSKWTAQRIALMLVAACGAWWLVTLSALQNPPDSLFYLFFCGMIGICAMILPGISGAFILLLLSRYEIVLNAIRSFVHLDWSVGVFTTLVVFSIGCLTGLLTFSRVLRRLLANHHDSTIAVLCGFMLGSLYRLWPFQRDLTPDIEDFKHKTLEHFLPNGLTSEVWAATFIAVIAAALVLTLDVVAGRAARLRQ